VADGDSSCSPLPGPIGWARCRQEGSNDHLLNFWLYLWAGDDNGHSCPLVQLRNTVLVFQDLPRFWFFQKGGVRMLPAFLRASSKLSS
jgi:hypothetical protein